MEATSSIESAKGIPMEARWMSPLIALASIAPTLLWAQGCAHQIMRGSVVMKIDDGTAHVCLGKGEVDVGDRVVLYDTQCGAPGTALATASFPVTCRRLRIGEARVIQTLNDHYSIVELDPSVQVKEGTIVEKK